MIPNATKVKYFNGSIDLSNDTIRVALYDDSSSYTPDPDTVEFLGDLFDGGTTVAEFSDTNYSRQSVSTSSVTQDDTDDEATWDGDDVTWSSLGGSDTIQGAVVYKQVGGDDTTPADDPILRVIDSSEESDLPLPTNGSDVTISWNAEGITTLQ